MVRSISGDTTPPTERPRKISAPSRASASVEMARVVANSAFSADRFLREWDITPFESHITTFSGRMPRLIYRRVHMMAAAPAPLTTRRTLSMSLPWICRALMSAAPVIIAVPCWSSCITGMSHSALRRRSISKHSGAFMSSRFMPPKVGASAFTISTKRPGSCSSTSMSKQSRPA